MAVDKKQVAMWVGGILASAAVAFLIYRLQQQDAAQNATNAADAAAAQESALANQEAETASLPSVSVPTISATPDPTDSANQGGASAADAGLSALIASMLSSDNSSTTSVSTPIASIAPLPYPTQQNIPDVTIPTLTNYSGASSTVAGGNGATASPISATPGTFTTINSSGANGYNTNLARPGGASLQLINPASQ